MFEKKKAAVFAVLSVIIVWLSFYTDSFFSEVFSEYGIWYLDVFFSLITNIGILILAMYAVPLIILHKKDKKACLMLSISLALSIIISIAIKVLLLRERPNIEINYGSFSVLDFSFPSMHAMIAFSFLPILVEKIGKYKESWIIFASCVALSRAYLQFHFMSDIIAGGLMGYAIGYVILKYSQKNKPELRLKKERKHASKKI